MDIARTLGLKLNQIEDRGIVDALKSGDRVPKVVHRNIGVYSRLSPDTGYCGVLKLTAPIAPDRICLN